MFDVAKKKMELIMAGEQVVASINAKERELSDMKVELERINGALMLINEMEIAEAPEALEVPVGEIEQNEGS